MGETTEAIGINHFGKWPLEDALRAIARRGYGAVDYSAAAGRMANDPDALAAARRLTRDLGLVPAGTHFRSFGIAQLTGGEERAKFAKETVEDVRAASFLGAKAMAVHAGNALGPASEGGMWSDAALAAANAEALRQAVRVAEQEGVTVALENHYKGFGERAAHLAMVADLLGSPAVGFTLDSGHAACSGQRPADVAREMGSRLVLTHLHDNDGKGDQHRPAGRAGPNGSLGGPAVIDWPALIGALREIGYPQRNAWVLEGGTQVPGDDPDALLGQHLACFREWLEDSPAR
ncbi:MAG TPA: sugar phosphate isomerase/epimerase [Chloroflexota bacterium]|nr:sugar phosphate isomerase/epimerase [Chloroflexota bacterium]